MSLAIALRDARGLLAVAALVLVLAWQTPSVLAQSEAMESRFRILEASTRLVDEVYLLDARVAFDFTPEALDEWPRSVVAAPVLVLFVCVGKKAALHHCETSTTSVQRSIGAQIMRGTSRT